MKLWTAEMNIKQRSVQQSTISAHELSYDLLRIRNIFKITLYCLSLAAVTVAINVEAYWSIFREKFNCLRLVTVVLGINV